MKFQLSFVFLFLLSSISFAESSIKGDKVYSLYKIVTLEAEGDIKDAAFIWRVRGKIDKAGYTPEPHVIKLKNKCYFTGPVGSYLVELLTIRVVNNQPLVDEAETIITIVGNGPGPSPPIPPPPIPPDPPAPPDDPLLIPIRTAFASDTSTSKVQDALDLAKIWRAASNEDFLKRAKTWKNLFADMHAAADIKIKDRLKPVRTILSTESKNLVPDINADIDIVKAKALLLRFAVVLESVSRGDKK